MRIIATAVPGAITFFKNLGCRDEIKRAGTFVPARVGKTNL
jgi:hypothetical protein